MPERRNLSFTNLADIMPEVNRLLAGHTTTGNWSLGQILQHLAISIRLSTRKRRDVAGGPYSEAFRRQFFRSGRIPEGAEVPHPILVPPADADAHAQAEALGEAIAHFADAAGPFPDHPLLGPLEKQEWSQFHCMHCAHHLSFALLADSPAQAGPQANHVLHCQKNRDVTDNAQHHV